MWNDFRTFIARGNVLDLAVGIIIGAAFKEIVSALVDGILMPPLGLLVGRVDLSNLYLSLGGGGYASLAEAREAGTPVIAYGLLLNEVIEFLIIAFAVFLLVRYATRLRRKEEAAPADPTGKVCPFCVFQIPIPATRCPHCTSRLDPE